MQKYFTLVFADGFKLNLTFRELLLILKHRYTLVSILCSFGAIFSFNPYEELSKLPNLYFSLVVMSIIATTLALYLLFIWLNFQILVRRKAAFFSVHSTVSMGISVVINSGITWILTETLTGEPLTYTKMVLLTCFNLVVSEIIITIYVNFLGDRVLREIRDERDFTDEVKEEIDVRNDVRENNLNFVNFGAAKVRAEEVIYVKSDDAYIDVNLKNGKNIYVRGRIVDVIERLGKLGFSPHRSFWVSYSAIKEVAADSRGYKKIILKNRDLEIPVAKAKEALVDRLISQI